MECYLPCFKFRIRTEEVRHSHPNPLDLFLLQYLLKYQRTEHPGGCPLEEFLDVFSFLGETIIFGILYKLHVNFLALTSRGTLLLNREVAEVMQSVLPEELASALGCRVGVRKQTYVAFFDLYAGRIFMDQGYVTLTQRDLMGKPALRVNLPPLRFRNPAFFSPGNRLALVNERLRRRPLPDGDFYEAESADIELLGEDDEPLRFLPILLGQGRVPHAGRELPEDLLVGIASQMRQEGRLAEAGALQELLQTIRPETAASVPPVENALHTGASAWVSSGVCDDPGRWIHKLIETADWMVITQEMLDALVGHYGTERLMALLASALERGVSIRNILPSFPPAEAPYCLASQDWAGSREWLPQPLLVLDRPPHEPSKLLPFSVLSEAAKGGERRYKDACRHLRRGAAARPILHFIPKAGTPPLPPFVLTSDSFHLVRMDGLAAGPWVIERYGWSDTTAAIFPELIGGLLSESNPVERALVPPDFLAIPSLRATQPPLGAKPISCQLDGSPSEGVGRAAGSIRLGLKGVRVTYIEEASL